MAQTLDCTCLQGLDLALKWASRRSDPDLVRCTASVAHDCLHRHDCRQRSECDSRLHQIDDWLAENGGNDAEERMN
ncbi:hypothetical protein H261_21451 [Paramagnetospirillum caucaseum]|uniref:Uncharacterized protein n=1 Tax=Paramagnetospirillum caucaseum TaxID=1244869 RepID=M2ZKM1_9PROT|nr:hypothetical protein [Paramagnetospirillum caucaseum]EME67852.1 hypothetical protein H261_21451 [Paramagnetospirillum caucaseum]